MSFKAKKEKSKLRNIFENLKERFLFKREEKKGNEYEVSEEGFKQLKSDNFELFDIARTFMLDYSQEWDTEVQKYRALKNVLRYVGLPFDTPRRRIRKVLKRDFKNELRNIERDHLNLEIVRVANILEKYRKIVKKEKENHKKFVK